MYRYIAFSWNGNDARQKSSAGRLNRLLLSASPDWQCVLDAPGLRVFHAPQPSGARHAYVLKRNAGVVLGKLFVSNHDQATIPVDPSLNAKESALIIKSHGRRLVDCYWGHYVAFLLAADGKRRFIVRDPTGALPCFLTTAEAGVQLVLSHVEDCAHLNLAKFSTNWDHVSAFFLQMRLVTRTTGFKEVSQLHAGECASIEHDAKEPKITYSFYWNPVDTYSADIIDDPARARAELRAIVRYCVNSWASCYDSIVHELSGGLDSSIVAASLSNTSARPDVLCFNFFTETSEGDERTYAQAAAELAGHELVECEVGATNGTLESHLPNIKYASPALLNFVPPYERLKDEMITERRAGAVFSGQGGDHLFQESRDPRIAAEYVRLHGLSPRLVKIITETSRLTHESIWSVFSATVRYGLFRQSFDPYANYDASPILTEDARLLLTRHSYQHPWVESARERQLPASKVQHVFNIVDCQPFYRKYCPNAELVHPLISQPIIELCLQIPTYVLTQRGKARGLIREAFEADLPAKVFNRYSKGATTSYFNRMMIENAEYLRDFLLDGVLVRQGIICRHTLERKLSQRELILGNALRPVLNAARAETWWNAWQDTKQQTAA